MKTFSQEKELVEYALEKLSFDKWNKAHLVAWVWNEDEIQQAEQELENCNIGFERNDIPNYSQGRTAYRLFVFGRDVIKLTEFKKSIIANEFYRQNRRFEFSERRTERMNIELVRLTSEYKEQLFEMLTEWKNDIIVNHTDMSPWKIWANDFHDFDYYLQNLDTKEETKKDWVPDTTLFCLDKDRNIFVGAVNIRHYLNDELLKTGGHIGDGIRPGERRKGYASAMIALALDECKKLGIDKALMCCDKDNIGSAKSIINNGGVLENEVEEDGHIMQRYWIRL